MGGGGRRREPYVLIPEPGAGGAKYLYVDPRAAAYGPQGFNPMAGQGNIAPDVLAALLNQPPMSQQQFEALHTAGGTQEQDFIDSVNRLMNKPEQDQSNGQSPNVPSGMTHFPNIAYDPQDMEDTSVMEKDGLFYVIPRYRDMGAEEAANEFIRTGEHLGGFSAEDDASMYQEQRLNPYPPTFQF